MKKFITTIIIACLIVISCLGLTACSDSNDELQKEKIKLTTENYGKYISINLYFSDCQVAPSAKTNEFSTYYSLSCIGNIETSKRINCQFEGVNILFDVGMLTGWTIGTPFSSLNWEGESHCSFSASKEDTSLLKYPNTTKYTILICKIEGYVIVPSESL